MTKHKIDPSTGLPELPVGYRWVVGKRVKSDPWIGVSYDIYYVSMEKEVKVWYRKKPKNVSIYFRDITVTRSGSVVYRGAPLTNDNILYTCELIMKAWNDDTELIRREEELLGEYPPNKLG